MYSFGKNSHWLRSISAPDGDADVSGVLTQILSLSLLLNLCLAIFIRSWLSHAVAGMVVSLQEFTMGSRAKQPVFS